MATHKRNDRMIKTERFPLGVARAVLLPCMVALVGSIAALAGDWPTYRHDMARSGVTSEVVQPPLHECWVFKARYAPDPASIIPESGWH